LITCPTLYFFKCAARINILSRADLDYLSALGNLLNGRINLTRSYVWEHFIHMTFSTFGFTFTLASLRSARRVRQRFGGTGKVLDILRETSQIAVSSPEMFRFL